MNRLHERRMCLSQRVVTLSVTKTYGTTASNCEIRHLWCHTENLRRSVVFSNFRPERLGSQVVRRSQNKLRPTLPPLCLPSPAIGSYVKMMRYLAVDWRSGKIRSRVVASTACFICVGLFLIWLQLECHTQFWMFPWRDCILSSSNFEYKNHCPKKTAFFVCTPCACSELASPLLHPNWELC